MAKSRRTVSAQTRVKLSRAAKSRKRAAKGTLHAGQFTAGASATRTARPMHFAAEKSKTDQERANKLMRMKGRMHQEHYGAPKDPRGVSKVTPSKKTDWWNEYHQEAALEINTAQGGRGVKDPDFSTFSGYMAGQSGRRGKRHVPGQTKQPKYEHSPREILAMSRAEASRKIATSPTQAAEELARGRAARSIGRQLEPHEVVSGAGSIQSADLKQIERDIRAASWMQNTPVYNPTGARPKSFTSTSKFIKQEMPEEHRRWLISQLEDPNSPFNQGLKQGNLSKRKYVQSAGAGHRLDMYVRQLQEGQSHADALRYIQQEHRGGGTVEDPSRNRAAILLGERGQTRGRAGKYDSARSHDASKYGIDAPSVDTVDSIKARFPGLTDKDYVKIQQAQRENIFDTVDKYQTWTHERAAAMLQGDRALQTSAGPDRVTFFTTNIGGPAPSVPSDSLIGQYIIKRRKKVLRDAKIATPRELSGRFPEAVRDMHIIEASTGISGGVTGSYGVFKKAGWRAGSKKSKNYGKPTPVGATVLYDNQGRPMYDEAGNLRYSEGLTRPFDYGTDKSLGLRIFVG